MGNSVAFVVAPYGFGPSSKAVAISSYLPRSIERVFMGQGPPLEMARRSDEFSACVSVDFRNGVAVTAEQLAAFDALIFVNSTRFITPSLIGDRPTILVETLSWLRQEPPPCASMLRAFFAQRFFAQAFSPQVQATANFAAVGPIVPRSIREAQDRQSPPKSPIVHCGGLFSPAMIQGAGEEFVAQILNLLARTSGPMRAIVPSHLHCRVRSRVDDRISLLECSPLSVHEHLAGSEFALTTTGIEFTYESILLGVPTLFLPPFNASQRFQVDYHRRACAESVPFDNNLTIPYDFADLHEATAKVQQMGMAGSWGVQFAEVSRFLEQFHLGERAPLLRRIQQNQKHAIEGMGLESARTIASRILHEVNLEFALQ